MADRKPAPLVRRAQDLTVAGLVYAAYGLFAMLPVDAASALGGRIARTIGPALAVSRRARQNLENAFPGIAKPDIGSLIKDMWESLGRTAGEAPHLNRLVRHVGRPGARVRVDGIANLSALQEDKPLIFVSGHLANWEVLLQSVAALGYPASPVFRDPNNVYLKKLLRNIRTMPGIDLVPKGATGARIAIKILSHGKRLILLADQKQNDGIAVPFFGRDAMTAPALARFALRYDCPIVPLRIVRLGGARFHLTIGAPLPIPQEGSDGDRIEEIMRTVNSLLESWIREHPAQWLWLHNRWPS